MKQMAILEYNALWAVAVAMFLIGCSGRPQATYSGFLRDYSQLKPHPDVAGAMLYENPAKNLKQYYKFIVDPVIVHFATNAEGTAIAPDDLKELTDYFRNQLVKALSESKRYQVVDAPGAGVSRLRIALTDIKKSIPALNIEPRMKMMGLGLGGAAMEAEAVDSVSGERVAAATDSESGGRMGLTAGLTTYGHAQQVMDGWINRFIARLDKAHGFAK